MGPPADFGARIMPWRQPGDWLINIPIMIASTAPPLHQDQCRARLVRDAGAVTPFKFRNVRPWPAVTAVTGRDHRDRRDCVTGRDRDRPTTAVTAVVGSDRRDRSDPPGHAAASPSRLLGRAHVSSVRSLVSSSFAAVALT